MTKFAILADTHFGVRSDSLAFDEYFKTFFENTFFPRIDSEGIKTVVHMGDVFDRRKFVNFQILRSCRKYFFDELQKRDIRMVVIPGNHDTYFKNTNEVNSLDLLLRGYQNIEIFHKTGVRTIEVVDILFVPWLCQENGEEAVQIIKSAPVSLCFGHFPIAGFEMYRGLGAEEGLPPKLFRKYQGVYSGHFHHRSQGENIWYLGSPYEMTWNDFNDPKGFHLFDGETLEFVENPHRMHYKIFYDDTKKQTFDTTDLVGKCIKLLVLQKTDYVKFEALIDIIGHRSPLELKILEDYVSAESEGSNNEKIDAEDMVDVLSKYIDGLETVQGDRARLKTLMRELYIEAQNTEE